MAQNYDRILNASIDVSKIDPKRVKWMTKKDGTKAGFLNLSFFLKDEPVSGEVGDNEYKNGQTGFVVEQVSKEEKLSNPDAKGAILGNITVPKFTKEEAPKDFNTFSAPEEVPVQAIKKEPLPF